MNAQGIPGPGDGDDLGFCECCELTFIPEGASEPLPGDLAAYNACKSHCGPGNPKPPECSVLAPIDSSLIVLLIAGALLGIYFVSKKNKKRQLEV